MTGTRDKLRSLFLTALMIGSVFAGTVAFSGAAAAASNAEFGTQGINDPTGTPASGSQGTLHAEVDRDNGDSFQQVQVDFSGQGFQNFFADVNDEDVTIFINGNNVEDDSGTFTNNDVTVESTSNEGNTIIVQASSSFSSSNLNPGDVVTIQFADNVNFPAQGSYSGTISIDPQGNNYQATGSLSVGSPATGTSFVADQDTDPDDSPQDRYDETLTSNGGPYWQGQKLIVKNTNFANQQLQLREADDTDEGEEVGSFVSDLTFDNVGEAIIDTSNREGDYVVSSSSSATDVLYFANGEAIVDPDGASSGDTLQTQISGTTSSPPIPSGIDDTDVAEDGTIDISGDDSDGNADTDGSASTTDDEVAIASFEVTVQSLSASFSETETDQEKTFLELDSNRGDYTVTVTSDGIDQEELANVFASEIDAHTPEQSDGANYVDNDGSLASGTTVSSLTPSSVDDEVVLDIRKENANISMNFSEVETGDYTLNFEVADTDASASDSITIVEDDDADAEILNPVVRAGEGDNAAIPIQLENTDEATVNVGYNDVNFNLTFDIEDGNDDGVVTAGIDLYTVGRADTGGLAGDLSTISSLPATTDTGGTVGDDRGHSFDELQKADAAGLIDINNGPARQLVTRDSSGNPNGLRYTDRQTYLALNALLTTQASVEPVNDDDTINNINLTAFPPDPRDNPGDIQIDDPPLDNADYDINVTDGGVRGTELAVGTLDVTQTSSDGLRTWTMSRQNYQDLDSDVDEAIPEIYDSVGSTLTQSDTVAQRDIMVFQYRGTGIFGALAAAKDDGEDYDVAMVELIRGDITSSDSAYDYVDTQNQDSVEVEGYDPGIGSNGGFAYLGDFDFTVEQTNPVANRNGKSLDFTETAIKNNGVRVVPDQRNSSLFIFIDEQATNVDRNEAEDRAAAGDTFSGTTYNPLDDVDDVEQTDLTMQDGEQYEANLSIADGALNNDDVIAATSEVEIVEKSLTYDTNAQDIIQVSAQSGQVISGSTSVAPGTELDLRIRSTGSSPFLRSPQPVVQPDGTFNASVDFSTVAENTSFTASARGFDDEEVPGVVGEAPVAQVSISNQSGDGTTVTVDSVTMSEGGFVVIHDSSLLQGQVSESVLGASDYLSEGQSTNVEVTLDEPLGSAQTVIAMPHLDTNGNQAYDFPSADGPYTANGTAVTDSAQYTIATPTTTAVTTTMPTTDMPTTTTEQPETDAPDTDTATPGGDGETETTTTSGPGFTAGLALVALAAAALLALRRRD